MDSISKLIDEYNYIAMVSLILKIPPFLISYFIFRTLSILVLFMSQLTLTLSLNIKC